MSFLKYQHYSERVKNMRTIEQIEKDITCWKSSIKDHIYTCQKHIDELEQEKKISKSRKPEHGDLISWNGSCSTYYIYPDSGGWRIVGRGNIDRTWYQGFYTNEIMEALYREGKIVVHGNLLGNCFDGITV